jgi:hypothetical protein
MELVAIDTSRIVYLTQLRRPAGQMYLPDAALKLAQRYSFTKLPSPDELTREPVAFSMGKFQDVQINEFQIYGDGIIATARAGTEILDAFISDVLRWGEREFGLVQAAIAKPEKYVESAILVKSTKDLMLAVAPANDVAEIVNKAIRRHISDVPYRHAGFVLDSDPAAFPGRRKPLRFVVERRLGVAYSENVFYSVAPLHTKDHLKVLSELEALSITTPTRLRKVRG